MILIIDAESFVYSKVSAALRAYNENIFVSGEYVDTPAKFPAVTLIEANNSIYRKAKTTNIENAVSVLYEANVFTNRIGYKKSDAKDILEVLDNEMLRLGFTRTMAQPMPNLPDATIYRITARYEGVIMPEHGEEEIIYRIYSN